MGWKFFVSVLQTMGKTIFRNRLLGLSSSSSSCDVELMDELMVY